MTSPGTDSPNPPAESTDGVPPAESTDGVPPADKTPTSAEAAAREAPRGLPPVDKTGTGAADVAPRGLPPVDKVRLEKSMRGIYSALLLLEAFVVLMVPATIRQFGVGLTGFRLTAIIVVVVGLIGLCALMKKPWAYTVGWVLQAAVVLMGFWVWAMWPLGLAFAAMWWYAGRLHTQLRARPDL